MSRNRSRLRTIVVGGKHFRWTVSSTDRSVVYVKLPEGGQRVLRTSPAPIDRWDSAEEVTPHRVAALIHEHVLGTPQPRAGALRPGPGRSPARPSTGTPAPRCPGSTS